MWQERTTNSDRETKKNKNKKKNGFQLNILKSLIRIWFDFNLFVNVRWFGFGDVCRRNFEQKTEKRCYQQWQDSRFNFIFELID